MRKSWLSALAFSLSLLGTTTAFSQYPNAYNNFGPSSYPVQNQPQMGSILQNLPQVPQNYMSQPAQYQVSPYQMVNVGQDNSAFYTQALQQPPAPPAMQAPMVQAPMVQAHTSPAPMNQVGDQGGSASGYSSGATAAPAMTYQQPMDYSYAQSVAPNCNSCGPAPVSGACGMQYAGSQGGGHHAFGLPQGASPWFFGGGALLFHRVDDGDVPLSFTDADYNNDVLTTRQARMPLSGGFEGTVGRYFNCGRNAIQATYWGLYPQEQTELRSRPANGEYASRIPFGFMTMSGTPNVPGTPYPVASWFDNAFAHELRRSSTFHNVEVNLLGFAMGGAARNFNLAATGSMFAGTGRRAGASCGYCGGNGCEACGTSCGPSKFATGPCNLTGPACGSRLNLSWLAGFRYFQFNDDLQYAASLDDGVINRAPDDLYYQVNTTNDLVGFQLGSRADYCLGQRLNAYGTAKVGVYNNHSTMYTRLGTDDADAYLNDTRPPVNPSNGQSYRFTESNNQVAFLSELGSGLGWRVTPKWSATVGYRAIVASGVATSVGNIRQTYANYVDVQNYNNDSVVILHGLNVGALYNF